MPRLKAIKCPGCDEIPIYLYKRKTNPETKVHMGYEFFGYWCPKCNKLYVNKLVEK